MRDINMIQSYQGARNLGLHFGSNGFWMTPIFASGQVLITSLLDNVLFQAYSKTHILDLVKLCCGVRFKQAIELDQMLGIDCSNVCLIDTPDQFVVRTLSSRISRDASPQRSLVILMILHFSPSCTLHRASRS